MSSSLLRFLFASLLAASLGACSIYRDDRCHVNARRYEQAKFLYDRVGALEVVRLTLEDAGWRDCEINEVEYRLTQEMEMARPGRANP